MPRLATKQAAGSSRLSSNAAAWSMVSCAYAATAATLNTWSRSVAPTVGALGERRGICPSCGARRMAESAALLANDFFPEQLVRQ
jgi:hypothetical protein